MNIDRHKRILAGREGGLEQLQAAFRRIGHPNIRLQAFELGDWLADVSQFVDPVATDPRAMRDGVTEIGRSILETIREWSPIDSLVDEYIAPAIDGVVGEIRSAVTEVFGTRPGDNRNAAFANHLRDTFRVAGYFRFVHPDVGDPGPRMDFDAYKAIFDGVPNRHPAQFSQYYPHEHLDRPNAPAQADPPRYDSRPDQGRLMYRYLAEDIEILIGQLAEADRDWATPLFDGQAQPDDTDIDFNMALAKLGRTMHMVEDFFAHSTFVEHAALAMPRGYAQRQTRGWNTRDIFQRRLQKWDHRNEQGGGAEPLLVTGYFDKMDTLVSLSHGLEDIFGVRFVDPDAAVRTVSSAATDPRRFLSEFGDELLFEFGELVSDPVRALNDPDNALTRYIQVNHPDLVSVIQRIARNPEAYFTNLVPRQQFTEQVINALITDDTLWQGVPIEVKGWFLEAVRWLGEVKQIAGAARSIYQIVQTIAAIYSSLERAAKAIRFWLEMPGMSARIPRYRGGGWRQTVARLIAKLVAAVVLNAIELLLLVVLIIGSQVPEIFRAAAGAVNATVQYYTRELLYRAIGAGRIGSHSLLAKDYDDSDPLSTQAFHLARGVHRYMIHVLARNDRDPGDQGPWRPIDWEELIWNFLGHPRHSRPRWFAEILRRNGLRNRTGSVAVTLGHTLRHTSPAARDRLIQRHETLRTAAMEAYQPAGVP